MKKTLLLLLALCPLLCGCGSLYAQRQEVEELRLMEAMGLDRAAGGVELSLAAAATEEEGSACYRAVGANLADALERLRSRAPDPVLFCGHLRHVLIGENYARVGLKDFLAAVCRSSDLRLDLPVYLLLDGTAGDAMAQAGDGEKGVVDALNALAVPGEERPRLSTAGAILRDLERRGCALVRTLRLQESAETTQQSAMTLVPAGYGVLVDGALRELIDPEDGVAAALLTETLSPCPLVLTDEEGRAVTLELQEGQVELRPVWDEKERLIGLELSVSVQAAVLEAEGFAPILEDARLDALTARLESELNQRIGRVLRLSRALGADFLGLGHRLELQAPLRCRGLGQELGGLLNTLQLSVSVQGELRHSNDIT